MPNYYAPYYYQPQQQMQAQPQPQAQPQIQNGGFVSVRNETEARNYPIAIGTSVTFKDENAPYIYNKTMGFSQLESPRFDKYRLVKEEVAEASNLPQTGDVNIEPINNSINALKAEIEAIWSEIEALKKKPMPKSATSKKKEVEEDDE